MRRGKDIGRECSRVEKITGDERRQENLKKTEIEIVIRFIEV